MNLDQLRYLMDLASTGSMNVTAKNMFISQPAVSDSIRRLENELNCTLLKRSKTGVTLTPEGELVLDAARRMVQEQDDLLTNLKRKATEKSITAEINVGVGYSTEETFFPKLLQQLGETYPNIHLHIKELSFRHFSEEHLKNQEGIGLYAFVANSPADYPEEIRRNFSIIPLYQEPLVVVMSADHPLIKESSITEEMLMKYPATSIGPDYEETQNENLLYLSTNMEMHRRYLRTQLCTITVPISVYKQHFFSKAFVYRLTDHSPLHRCLILPKKFETNMPAAYSAFIDTAVQLSAELK